MSQTLVAALQNPALYDHSIEHFELIETHISWVLLTGPYAYKIKKPQNFGFLDFSTLDKRHFYCEQELHLNQRTAPDIYLQVVAIGGSETAPRLDNSPAIEYAIKMRQFPQAQLLDRMLARDELGLEHIDAAAKSIADFHLEIAQAPAETDFGRPAKILAPVTQNFEQIQPFLEAAGDLNQLEHIQAWAQDSYQLLEPRFRERKQAGFIRECHGDLHLGNITLLEGKVTLFDCIEFNEDFRWTDVMADIGFLIMDLEHRGLQTFANQLLNSYLERTGDYAGLQVLNFYKSYRAMVRAKVALFNLYSDNISTAKREEIFARYHSYADLAERYTQVRPRHLLLMHGYSGSGKTTVSTALVQQLGAIRLRSDVERKRLFPGENDPAVLYSQTASDATFTRLAQLAQLILQAGYPVVIDATSLHKPYRDIFTRLGEHAGVPLHIIDCRLEDAEIRLRLEQRERTRGDASDANVAIYEHQLQTAEPLSEAELATTLIVDTRSAQSITDFTTTLAQSIDNPLTVI